MMNFFKRPVAPSPASSAKPAHRHPVAKTTKPVEDFGPLPVAEVIEGNDDSDWSLWEDSVAFQDGQMFAVTEPVPLEPKMDKPAAKPANPADASDPFKSIHSRTP